MNLIKTILWLPWQGLRHGKICGTPITRNPIAWLPYFCALPFFLIGGALYYLLFLPIIIVLSIFSWFHSKRYKGIVSEDGIRLGKAYQEREVAWADITGFAFFGRGPGFQVSCRIAEQTEKFSFLPDTVEACRRLEKKLTEHGIPIDHSPHLRPAEPETTS